MARRGLRLEPPATLPCPGPSGWEVSDFLWTDRAPAPRVWHRGSSPGSPSSPVPLSVDRQTDIFWPNRAPGRNTDKIITGITEAKNSLFHTQTPGREDARRADEAAAGAGRPRAHRAGSGACRSPSPGSTGRCQDRRVGRVHRADSTAGAGRCPWRRGREPPGDTSIPCGRSRGGRIVGTPRGRQGRPRALAIW